MKGKALIPIGIIGLFAAGAFIKGNKLADVYQKLDVYPSANPKGTKYIPLTSLQFEIPVELVNHSPHSIDLGYPSARFFVNGTNVGYADPKPGTFTMKGQSKESFTMTAKVNLGSALFAKFTSGSPFKIDMEIFGTAAGFEYSYKYPITV